VSQDQPGSDQEALPAFYTSKTELTLGLSAFLVAMTTFVFGVAMTIVGYLSFAKYREVERKMAKELTELGEARKKVASLDRELDEKIKKVRADLERQEKVALENRRYFEAVRGELFNLLVGIVENVRQALGPGQEGELKALIGEAEACLSLFNPDLDEVKRALWRLETIGSAKCVSPINTLVEDSSFDPEMRLRAQRVLHAVTDRLEDGDEPVPKPGAGDEAPESGEDQSRETPGDVD